jgi:hypothetical protein
MQKAFQILKEKPQISVVLTRDSVCAGDDCDAPHEKTIRTPSFLDPEVLVRETSSGYLPSVAGIGHSWICILNKTPIAEIKTTGIKPLVREITFDEENKIHFSYKSARY